MDCEQHTARIFVNPNCGYNHILTIFDGVGLHIQAQTNNSEWGDIFLIACKFNAPERTTARPLTTPLKAKHVSREPERAIIIDIYPLNEPKETIGHMYYRNRLPVRRLGQHALIETTRARFPTHLRYGADEAAVDTNVYTLSRLRNMRDIFDSSTSSPPRLL